MPMFKVSSAICVLLAICNSAVGIINIELTPRQLVDVAGIVMVGTVVKDGQTWKLRVDDVVKGNAPPSVTLDLSNCNKDQVGDIQALLTENISRPAVSHHEQTPRQGQTPHRRHVDGGRGRQGPLANHKHLSSDGRHLRRWDRYACPDAQASSPIIPMRLCPRPSA